MNPVYQQEENDCFSCCIATFLGLRHIDVPNFARDTYADGSLPDSRKLLNWFRDRGYNYLQMAWPAEPGAVLTNMARMEPDLTFVLIGHTVSGSPHAALARDGKIIFDPARSDPSMSGICRPCGDGYTRAGIIAVRPYPHPQYQGVRYQKD